MRYFEPAFVCTLCHRQFLRIHQHMPLHPEYAQASKKVQNTMFLSQYKCRFPKCQYMYAVPNPSYSKQDREQLLNAEITDHAVKAHDYTICQQCGGLIPPRASEHHAARCQ